MGLLVIVWVPCQCGFSRVNVGSQYEGHVPSSSFTYTEHIMGSQFRFIGLKITTTSFRLSVTLLHENALLDFNFWFDFG